MDESKMKEKRRHCRIPYNAQMQVSWVSHGQAWSTQAQCLDLSVNGVRFEVAEPVDSGTVVRLRNDEIDFMGTATVRHVEARGALFSVGLELSPETSADIFGSDATDFDD
jgi:PilZ domain-containing protein